MTDGVFTQWRNKIANDMPIHYQVVLAPDDVLPFIEQKVKSRGSIHSFRYKDKNNLGRNHEYFDRIRSDNYFNTSVSLKAVQQCIEEFSSLIHHGSIYGTTVFGVVADVYVGLPSKNRTGIEKLIGLHGIYDHSHNDHRRGDYRSMREYSHTRNLEIELESDTNYPSDKEIASEARKNGLILLRDEKTRYEKEFYEWDGQDKATKWRHKQSRNATEESSE